MAAAGIGNPAGYQPVLDGANPRIVGGVARNAIISGGVFCFASGATGVVSSGANSFVTGDILFAGDASGGEFNGICVQTTAVSGNMSVATRGAFLLVCNGNIDAGALFGDLTSVECFHQEAIAVFAGTHIRQWYAQNLGITIRLSGHFHQARSCLQNGIIGSFITIRAETGHTQPYDIRSQFLEAIIINPQFFVVLWKLICCKYIDL